MEQICRKQTVAVSRPVMDVQEEYTLSGDFVLPEYCPDVAVVLKCLITPYIVSRQWSGDQLMLSGTWMRNANVCGRPNSASRCPAPCMQTGSRKMPWCRSR